MIQEHQIKILMLMYDLEKALSEMYVVFSELFPDHKVLWKILIREERAHAEAVRKLYKLTYEGQALFNEGAIKATAVRSVTEFIRGVCDNAKAGRCSEIQALVSTHDIEKSLLETALFKHFSVSPLFAEVLHVLHEGTNAHVKLSKGALGKARSKIERNKAR